MRTGHPRFAEGGRGADALHTAPVGRVRGPGLAQGESPLQIAVARPACLVLPIARTAARDQKAPRTMRANARLRAAPVRWGQSR